MRARLSSAAALALWLLFAVGTGLGFYIAVANAAVDDLRQAIPFLIAFASFATVGLVVASRRPQNPLGWIFLSIGILTSFASLSDATVGLAVSMSGPLPPVVVLAAWAQNLYWFPLVSLSTVFTLLLFPSGLPSRRWRPVLWVSILEVSAITVLEALRPTLDVAGRRIPNPIGVPGINVSDIEETPLFWVFNLILIAAIVSAAISLVLRYRHALGDERQQLKWFMFSAVLLGLSFTATFLFPAFEQSTASEVIFPLVLALLPLSVGTAILSYRLYAIDVLINRTLVYGTLTILLAGVYYGGVALLQSAFRALTGQGSPLAVVLSTLAIAAAFSPLRRRIQAFIDHRFYRRKYDAQRALASFGTTARDEVELEMLAQALVGVVDETMQPAEVSLWVREQG